MKIIVSACLLGRDCKYNGGNNRAPAVADFLADFGAEAVPLCPETAGGLPVPRPPAEQRGDRVCTADGLDLTAAYERGAAACLREALECDPVLAILQPRSPSCGCREVYDGSFTRRLIPGSGRFAAALRGAGIPAVDADRLTEARQLLLKRGLLPRSLTEGAAAVFAGDSSGHDFAHTLRVLRTARRLAAQEGADPEIVSLAALLHDVDDAKLPGSDPEHLPRARALMAAQEIPEAVQAAVCRAVRQVSFKGTDSVTPDTPEGKVVQDADRLDAIGAVGIARAFAFGGSRGRALYDPSDPPRTGLDAESYRRGTGSTINHFYEKLLLLKDMMNTPSARALAEKRHRYMEEFLAEFDREWNGEA